VASIKSVACNQGNTATSVTHSKKHQLTLICYNVCCYSHVVGSMVGAHKKIITGPKGKSLHKGELTRNQTVRDVHHRIKTNAPLQQHHSSHTTNRSVKATTQLTKSSHVKNITQDTSSKILETTSDTQDTKVRCRIFTVHI